jgi:hypothetical protein
MLTIWTRYAKATAQKNVKRRSFNMHALATRLHQSVIVSVSVCVGTSVWFPRWFCLLRRWECLTPKDLSIFLMDLLSHRFPNFNFTMMLRWQGFLSYFRWNYKHVVLKETFDWLSCGFSRFTSGIFLKQNWNCLKWFFLIKVQKTWFVGFANILINGTFHFVH